MKQEAVDYGYIPRHIAEMLDDKNPAPVSNQVENLITKGRLEPDAFLVSLTAAYKEASFFAQTAPNPEIAAEQAHYAGFYRKTMASTEMQKLICLMKMDDMLAKQAESLRINDKMKARFFTLAVIRWRAVCQSIDSKEPKNHLTLIK